MEAKLLKIASQFDLAGEIAEIKPLGEGFINDNKEDSQYAKDRRTYLISYDRAIPRLRQADRCAGCGICAIKCPQQINIPGEIRRIDRFVESLKRSR